MGRIDYSIVKTTAIATQAPHLDTKDLIKKIDDVTKTVDLDVTTTLAEQIKDPVFGTVRLGNRRGSLPDAKISEFQQCKGFLRYCQEFDRLLIKKSTIAMLLGTFRQTGRRSHRNWLTIIALLSLF